MSNCSCIAGNFNFYAEAIDRKTIIFQDLSEWASGDGYEYPSEYEMEVIPPATSKSYKVTVKTGQINKYTEEQIGTIKDGVYCFKVDSCDNTITRSTALFPTIECCVRQSWATLDESKYDQLREIENNLKQVVSHVELNNIQSATKKLNITKKLLENLKCDCDC